MAAESPPICAYIISHGRYNPSGKNIEVPHNINLVQYSKPGTTITILEAEYIYRMGCTDKVAKKIYFVTKTGKIYESNYSPKILPPGSKTHDLSLTFTVGEFSSFRMGIELPDGRLIEHEVETHDTLGNVLSDISERYPDKMLNVIQLSCRAGDYGGIDDGDIDGVIDELTRAVEAISIPSAEKIGNFKESDKLVYITENKKEAESKSKKIKENNKRKKDRMKRARTRRAQRRFEDIVKKAIENGMGKHSAIMYARGIMEMRPYNTGTLYIDERELNLAGEKEKSRKHKSRKHKTRKHKKT